MLRPMSMRRSQSVAGAVAAIATLAVSGCTSSSPKASPSSAPSPSLALAVVRVATSPEPTPYKVPTSPATSRLLKYAPALPISSGKSSEWTLARLPDGGRSVVIRFFTGCKAPAVEWDESASAVRVRVPYLPDSGGLCLVLNYRALHLSAPLGDRHLLHVTG